MSEDVPNHGKEKMDQPKSRVLVLELPIETVSEANKTGEHWSSKSARHKLQQWKIRITLRNHGLKIALPCTVKLTRLMPRLLDSDNVVSAFKWIRDEIGNYLIPGKAKGQADNDPRIKWEYDQEKSDFKGIRIEIYLD